MIQTKPIRRRGERGFALLFIFAMAGMVAIMLYSELPRAVFESQRAKEDLLVSRGQEYQRGIQLYFRKFRKYPATMEELEKSNGIRFLRRRYPDPFTGKDNWRLVHVGANGQFTDSKVIKPQQPAQGMGFGSTPGTEEPKQDPNDPALKKRASDVSASEIGNTGAAPANPDDPNALPTGPPPPPGQNPYPGRTNNPNAPQQGMPPVSGVGGVGSVGGVGGVGSTGSFGGVGSAGGGFGGVGSAGSVGIGQPNTGMPTGSISPMPGPNPGYPQNQSGQRPLTAEQVSPALNIIQDLLTRPRQPPPGVMPTGPTPSGPMTNPSGTFAASGPAAGGGNGQFGGGGIAGVASTHEGKGIKLVNDRDRIEEWEFIYDYGKDRGGRPNTNSQGQQPGSGGPLNPAQGTGFGGGGGFGQQPAGGGMGRPQGGFGQQQPGMNTGRPRN